MSHLQVRPRGRAKKVVQQKKQIKVKVIKPRITSKVVTRAVRPPPSGRHVARPSDARRLANVDQVIQTVAAAGNTLAEGAGQKRREKSPSLPPALAKRKRTVVRPTGVTRKGKNERDDVGPSSGRYSDRESRLRSSSDDSASRSRSRGRARAVRRRFTRKPNSESDSESSSPRRNPRRPKRQRALSARHTPPRAETRDVRTPSPDKSVDRIGRPVGAPEKEYPRNNSVDLLVVREPPRFTGGPDGPNVEAYKSKARLYLAQLSNQSPYKQMVCLNMMISSEAREIADVHADRLKTPQDLFDLMTEYFPRGAEEAEGNLDVYQREGELVMAYRARVEAKIARSWLSSLNQLQRGKVEVDTFLRGLLPEYYDKLGPSKYTNLKEAAESVAEIAKRMKSTLQRRGFARAELEYARDSKYAEYPRAFRDGGHEQRGYQRQQDGRADDRYARAEARGTA